ncbi:glycoprotein endo-alpha-1,2-mannosidase-like [Anneissia japonica]|uniref:glycoprotein endo-alpha-1,2-mannosidase-like n=1 Tax=Anneissia japonica TaxID=1529436 RepID=UPI001425A194|nr:glycoprotein endo-alpha-1,2-mannosidase-like [Anneissia japonica]
MAMGRRKILRRLIILVFVLSLSGCFIAIIHLTRIERKIDEKREAHVDKVDLGVDPRIPKVATHIIQPRKPVGNKTNIIDRHFEKENPVRVLNKTSAYTTNDKVHAFYYPWYGNPEYDGEFLHWDHKYLPHWDKKQAKKWKSGQHVPVDDIGANFYPELGCYSSRDPKVINAHMQYMYKARVGVLVVSWYPPGKADNEGHPSDDLMPILLDAAHRYQLKVAIHSEPYKDRDETTVKADLKYIMSRYGNHPALYRYGPKSLPLIYLYDSYLTPARKWKSLLKPGGQLSIRGTDHDAVLIALLVEEKHMSEISNSGFDGLYTYFAATGFTYGSTYRHWSRLAKYATEKGMLFIPSIGPGYIDVNIRPWNGENTRSRSDGSYYETAFKNALQTNPDIISITSFNEWHEGSQIEPAIPKSIPKFTYLDYGKNGPNYYLDLTRKWVEKFESNTY